MQVPKQQMLAMRTKIKPAGPILAACETSVLGCTIGASKLGSSKRRGSPSIMIPLELATLCVVTVLVRPESIAPPQTQHNSLALNGSPCSCSCTPPPHTQHMMAALKSLSPISTEHMMPLYCAHVLPLRSRAPQSLL